MSSAHLDHVFANSHQLIVQFRIHHLHLLELEDLLVAARRQLLLFVLQTLNNLENQSKADKGLRKKLCASPLKSRGVGRSS